MFIANSTKCDHRIGDPVVAYTQNNCPRCLGAGWYGGFDFSTAGKLVEVKGVDAVVQKILKVLSEKKRPTGYGLDYDLLSSAGTDVTNVLKYEVYRCITYLIGLQQQEKMKGVEYNPSEEISVVDSIVVQKSATNPRMVTVSASVTTVSGLSVSTSTTIKI